MDTLSEDLRGSVCLHQGPGTPLGQWGGGHPREVSGPAAHSTETQPTQEGSRLVRMGACKFKDCIFQRD